MAFISFNSRVAEHRTRFVCLGETPSPRVRCLLALFTYLLTYGPPTSPQPSQQRPQQHERRPDRRVLLERREEPPRHMSACVMSAKRRRAHMPTCAAAEEKPGSRAVAHGKVA